MRGLGPFLRDAWHLARPYFRSEERASAWVLLISILSLNLSLVGMDVVLNFWRGAFYDSLQNKDWDAFIQLLFLYRRTPEGFFGVMPGFSAVAAVYILVAVYSTYLTQWLRIRWRRWLTGRFLDEWLADRAYYRISLTTDSGAPGTDNPDQRIAEDLRDFVAETLSIGLDLFSNVISLISFVGVLWALSGPVTIWGITIPGYLVWALLLYAILGTTLTHLIGRPLAVLNFRQQRYEADFRFALVRLRENMEGVALYGGEAEEKQNLRGRFGNVVLNWWAIMSRTKALNSLVSGYQQVAVVFPFIVAAPRYFSGAIPLGSLMRTVGAFSQVQQSLSWFVTTYATLATWRAVVERLASFHRAIVAARAVSGWGVQAAPGDGDALRLDGVTLELPDGTTLLDRTSLAFPRGEATVISGRSGSGKSTLFRAIAGIWPFGAGEVRRPPGTYLFLPQRPYLPLGTLRHVVCYPADPAAFSDADIQAALTDAGLAHLIPELDEDTLWAQRLSGGEQQRVAIARALLLRPDWLFMDEATASLDPTGEDQVYRMLRERLRGTTIVSIAHRPEVAKFHEHRKVLRRGEGLLAAE